MLSGIQILCFCVDTNIVMLVSNWDTTISNQDLWIYGRHLDVSCVYSFIAGFEGFTVDTTH